MLEPAVKKAFDELIAKDDKLKKKGGGPKRVLVMSGLPLSGKSYLSNMIQKRLNDIVIVRSDDIRPAVARAMGRKRPTYELQEHKYTFTLAEELVKKALKMNWPVIADATNLKDVYRSWAYAAADANGAEVLVVFVEVSDRTALDRLSERDRNGSAATYNVYEKLKFEMEPIGKCTRPYVIVDSGVDQRPYAKSLADWLSGKDDDIRETKKPGKKVNPPEEETGKVDFYTGEAD